MRIQEELEREERQGSNTGTDASARSRPLFEQSFPGSMHLNDAMDMHRNDAMHMQQNNACARRVCSNRFLVFVGDGFFW